MAEKKKDEKVMTQNYTVAHFEDGTVEVKDSGLKDTETLNVEQIYDDIVNLAKFIDRQRNATLAYNAGYQAAVKFFQDLQAQQNKAKGDTTTKGE
jgi:hypothetical protein